VGGCDGGGRGKSVLVDFSVSLRSESGGVGGKSADTRRRCTRSSSVAWKAILMVWSCKKIFFVQRSRGRARESKVKIVGMDQILFWLWWNQEQCTRSNQSEMPRRKADHKNTYNSIAKLGQRLYIRHTGMSRHATMGGEAE
jgi:hypothetical protein